MKTQPPSGSRGRAGARISNLSPWLSLLCMVIYISVVEASPNHRRSRVSYRMKLPRHYSELRTSTRFLLITFLITWPAWWLNAVLTSAGIIDYSSPIGTAIHTAGVFGPTIAGLSLIPGGFTLKRGLAFTFGGLRRSLPWTSAFLVVPLVLLTAASDGLAEGFSPISAMGVFLAALMVSGGNEELGWRAVLEPELERRIPFFAACLATGAIWGLWHLPLWFTQGAGRETTPFLAFVALAVLLSFWLSALYRAGGCAFSCCLLHALANTLIGVLSLSNISLVIAAALALTGLSLAAFRRRLPIEEVCGGKPECRSDPGCSVFLYVDRRARGGARSDPEDPAHYIGHLHSVLALRKRIARIRERASGAPQLNSLNVRIEFHSEQSRLPDDSHPKRRPWQAMP